MKVISLEPNFATEHEVYGVYNDNAGLHVFFVSGESRIDAPEVKARRWVEHYGGTLIYGTLIMRELPEGQT